jgi:hypothetical protein
VQKLEKTLCAETGSLVATTVVLVIFFAVASLVNKLIDAPVLFAIPSIIFGVLILAVFVSDLVFSIMTLYASVCYVCFP